MSCLVFALLALLAAVPAVGSGAGEVIWDDRPGDGNWQNSWYPLGNGAMGAMVSGGTDHFTVQFNADSLWTGGKNPTKAVSDKDSGPTGQTMGRYQSFGILDIINRSLGPVRAYRRELDLSRAVYSDSIVATCAGWSTGEERFTRTAFASRADNLVAIRYSTGNRILGGRYFEVQLRGQHGEKVECAKIGRKRAVIGFSGVLPNGLGYRARADVVADGEVGVTDDGECLTLSGRPFTVYLRTATSYDMGREDMGLSKAVPQIGDAIPKNFNAALQRHLAEYTPYWRRVSLDLGGDAALEKLPTRERVRSCRDGARDVALEALLFRFGRYLLISSSRPGTLPANLQGVWNESNRPEWYGDYHTNINLEMNYWGADVANLSECFEPLTSWMTATRRVTEENTRLAFPRSKGYAYRTSANVFGGCGWRWNFAGAPWLAAQAFDHWRYTRDATYLRETCWPIMRGAAEFLMTALLKERADGTVVVKNGWSPEHGPREDGVAHDQQIVRELFRGILAAAKELKIDDAFTREVARLEPKLLKDKVGKWGQLQEWEADRDVKGDKHRHTSHLFAVYPGTTITQTATPDLFRAARVALEGRALTDDARRSWTWPWRAALWARFGDGEKAGAMVASLLRHNTLDGLFCTHSPIQLDGNFGIVAAIAEMLVQSHERTADGRTLVRILPALPKAWASGEAKGLKVRGGSTIDLRWADGKPVEVTVRTSEDENPEVVFADTPCVCVRRDATQPLTRSPTP